MIHKSRTAAHECIVHCVLLLTAVRMVYAAEKVDEVPLVSEPSVRVYALNAGELEFHMPRALAGDRESGYCVAMHFAFIDFKNSDAEFWISVGAENGDATSMQHLAVRLKAKGDARAEARAKFWKTRSAESSISATPKCHRPASK